MLMVMFMKDSGRTIKPMAKVIINMRMELHILAIGKMINNMDRVLRHGQMVLAMRALTLRVKNTAKENSNLQMDQFMKENFSLMRYQERVNTCGQTKRPTKVNGKRTKCMVMAY